MRYLNSLLPKINRIYNLTHIWQYRQKQKAFSCNLEENLPKLDIIVTIPCFKEPDIFATLKSLESVETDASFAVFILVNDGLHHSETDRKLNIKLYSELQNSLANWKFTLKVDYQSFTPKIAGVGNARKILMDAACFAFEKQENPSGIIVGLDGDTVVEKSYIEAIYQYFSKNTKTQAASIHFEHPLSGPLPTENYEAIIAYELHLRYYNQALRKAGLPTAYQTVGSAMAVRAAAYAAKGGMNKRKAGEDFYFLHKFTNEAFGEIGETKVIPSPRVSARVPFGTGKAIGKFLDTGTLLSHDMRTFEALKIFLHEVYEQQHFNLNDFPVEVQAFLKTLSYEERIAEIKKHSRHPETTKKRFSAWFNAFIAMKYTHFVREQFYPDRLVGQVVYEWLCVYYPEKATENIREQLLFLRELEKSQMRY